MLNLATQIGFFNETMQITFIGTFLNGNGKHYISTIDISYITTVKKELFNNKLCVVDRGMGTIRDCKIAYAHNAVNDIMAAT